jgi:integrase
MVRVATDDHRAFSTERLERHVRPVFGKMLAVEVTATRVKRYVAMRRGDGAANATINRELSVIRTALAIGAKAEPPIVVRVPHIPKLHEDNVREGFLARSDYEKLRDQLPSYLKLIFVCGYHWGVRAGELKAIKWEQVDLEHNQVLVSRKTTKNREAHTLPIYGEMRAWIDMAKTARDTDYPECPWLFSDHGVQLLSFRKAWASACRRAGVTGLKFHDLRRSAARNMDMAGIPRKVIMAITGHKTESMFLRYRIVSQQDLTDAAKRMERWLEAKPEEKPKVLGGAIQ